MMELKELFLKRNYSEIMVDSSIERAKKVPRKAALKKVVKNLKQRGLYLL